MDKVKNSLLEGMERLGLMAARIRKNNGAMAELEVDILLQELCEMYKSALLLGRDVAAAADPDAAAEEAKRKAEEQQAAEEAKRKAEEDAKRIAEALKAAEERRKAEAEAKRAAEEAKRAAEAKAAEEEAQRKAAEEAKRKADEEARRKAEEQRKAEENRKAEEEAKRKAEEARQARIAEEQRRVAEEARKAEEEAKRKAEEQRRAEEEALRMAQVAAAAKAAEEKPLFAPDEPAEPVPEVPAVMESMAGNPNDDLFSDAVEEKPMAKSAGTIFDQLNTEHAEQPAAKRTLADTLTHSGRNAEDRLEEKVRSKKVDDLRTVIGINDKFSFFGELFHSNMRAYNDFILRLNAISDRAEALAYVEETAEQFHWDTNSLAVKNFYKVFDRKF